MRTMKHQPPSGFQLGDRTGVDEMGLEVFIVQCPILYRSIGTRFTTGNAHRQRRVLQ